MAENMVGEDNIFLLNLLTDDGILQSHKLCHLWTSGCAVRKLINVSLEYGVEYPIYMVHLPNTPQDPAL